ncbi:hypothetical protein QBC42DRAFT_261258 [Cladorrhinum samala]|uniref:WAP domain-containing protein n=1 Tax=Cladorrhinum samala TaxID=585594 RepID=A0AAV9I0C2_9PEZI|nr:hypothetical protein QBC42DRAFT_261258 [Cladorrhinum samala]
MRSAFQVTLFFLLGTAAGLAIPLSPSPSLSTLSSFYPATAACHSILTNCRVDADCCSGLRCGSYDGEHICTPGG